MTDQLALVHAADRERYEGTLEGHLVSYVDYTERNGVVTFAHTVTDPAYGGRGFAAQVVKFALDDVRRRGGLTVNPACWYVAGYIERHPEYAQLLVG